MNEKQRFREQMEFVECYGLFLLAGIVGAVVIKVVEWAIN